MSYTPLFPHAIDNTMRKQLVKCQKAAHYQFELGLRPLTESRVDLHAGAAYAKGHVSSPQKYNWFKARTNPFGFDLVLEDRQLEEIYQERLKEQQA